MEKLNHFILETFGLLLVIIPFSMSFAVPDTPVITQHDQDNRVCMGTSSGMSFQSTALYRYRYYKDMYENCTYIDGNLEIIFLNDFDIDYDLSFLKTIREVHGYILIMGNLVDSLHLDSLTLIRGANLFVPPSESGNKYSLFVALNGNREGTRGLKELQFKNLREILAGDVLFQDNPSLCYENTIDWSDITTQQVSHKRHKALFRRNCTECDPACYSEITKSRHCWGAGPNMCQVFTKADCAPSCGGRCFGPAPNQCCSSQCVGGCNGTDERSCFSCRNFSNEDECVLTCPPTVTYDTQAYDWIRHKNGKYAFGPVCVDKCPNHLVVFKLVCVKSCPEGFDPDKTGTCAQCIGACPKVCRAKVDYINSKNIKQFQNCTIIEDNIRLLPSSFVGDKFLGTRPLTAKDLDIFKTVREVYGFVQIQMRDFDIKTLSFLNNLEVIGGNQLNNLGSALQITTSTYLEYLDLSSLRLIKYGKINIDDNPNLCYADTIDYSRILKGGSLATATLQRNAQLYICMKEKKVCDKECTLDGCWGPGPERCMECLNSQVHYKNQCLKSCSEERLLYDGGNRTCYPCHKECNRSCTGPSPVECDSCQHVQDGKICLKECPPTKYNDAGICKLCHPNCGRHGCTGPTKWINFGGCKNCDLGMEWTDTKYSGARTVECLHPNITTCPSNYYKHRVPLDDRQPAAGNKICMKCHAQCLTCITNGAWNCPQCRNVRSDKTCVAECPPMTYDNNGVCTQCNEHCSMGCDGVSSFDCIACVEYKVYLAANDTQFNCTSECPAEQPIKISEENGERLCVNENHPEALKLIEDGKINRVVIIVCSVVGVILIVVILFICFRLRRSKIKSETLKMANRINGYDREVPLTPTSAEPDLAQLVLANESELRRGHIIGSGAFGTVYNGIYIPQGKNAKIPVAIKVLGDDMTPEQNRELLEEARVMASVDHVYCIHILAVCMTAQVMLITQLVPYGNLLDYIRKHKSHIGSKVLLNWCTQIAQGMEYLEGRGIVHRDLAARNVLVQRPYHIRITDFGLAKLLDYNQDAYQAAGGKMPIKWLALECIQHRKFTHKSDVWSYGVTLWELFTYGKKPYENIAARDIPDMLEKGERLPQPSICTIDVYMIMIKCWMLDADSRPSFRELGEEFKDMARDPGRYLVIEGDRLLRLPSHGVTKDDMLRNASVADDMPGEVMDAEEYLQPQGSDSVSGDPNYSPSKPLLEPEDFTQSSPGQSNHKDYPFDGTNPLREKRYGHLEDESARRRNPQRTREDSVASRYSSDPIKLLLKGGPLDEEYLPPSPPIPLPEHDSPLKKHMRPINVDENDYLQPQYSHHPKYLEVLDGRDYYNELDETASNPNAPWKPNRHFSPNNSTSSNVLIDNPEYFDEIYDDAFESKQALLGEDPSYVNSTQDSQDRFNRVREPSESTV